MLGLKQVLIDHKISQAKLARAVAVSPATIAQLINHDIWPVKPSKDRLQDDIVIQLQLWDIAVKPNYFEPVPAAATADTELTTPATLEAINMLLRKQTLTQAARKHWGLFRDPFNNDIESADDVFLTPDIRYVREHLWQTAKHGGFMAVVGESGAGKSTLRKDLEERISLEQAPIMLMSPYILGMEDSDKKGKTLRAASIADAMIRALNAVPKMSMEAKSAQLHKLLRDSRRAGFSHVLVIEEAHALHTSTLKHLKRFFELEDGFKKLLGIILIGQTELKTKLSERSPEVREVVQRCEVIELPPLDAQLEPYLRFKFSRVQKEVADVFDHSAVDAIRERLILPSHGRQTLSLMYPLMINNLLVAAMNQASELGFNRLTRDLILEV